MNQPVSKGDMRTNDMVEYVIVLALSIITYLNAIPADFVFDDTAAIQANPDIVEGTSISSLLRNDFWGTPIGSRFSHQSYRPITVLSFRLDYEIWGELSREQFHFTNVILHAVASCTFLRLCRRFVFETSSSHLSIMSALLFATHPVHVEAVTGLVGRAEVLCAIFFMISIECHARACRASVSSSNPWIRNVVFMFLCIISSCLALLSKEIGITSLGVSFAYVVVSENMTSIHITRRLQHPTDTTCLHIWKFEFQSPASKLEDGMTSFVLRFVFSRCVLQLR